MKKHQANDPNEGASTRYELPADVELATIESMIADGRKSTAELDRKRKRKRSAWLKRQNKQDEQKRPREHELYDAIVGWFVQSDAPSMEHELAHTRPLHRFGFFDTTSGSWHRWKVDHGWVRCDGKMRAEVWRKEHKATWSVVRGAVARAELFFRLREEDEADPLNPRELVGFPDGTVLTADGRRRPVRQHDYVTRRTAAAPALNWDRFAVFLEEWIPDEDSRLALQRTIGLALMGETHRRFLVFHGDAGSGKTTCIHAIARALGSLADTVSSRLFHAGGNEHETLIASVRGLRLAWADEVPAGRAMAVERLKALTGGGRISARFMRRDHFSFSPRALLVLCANEVPFTKVRDDALLERLRIVRFPNRFKPDTTVAKELEELDAEIVAWAVDGWRLARTLQTPNDCESWKKATNEFSLTSPVPRVIQLEIDRHRGDRNLSRTDFVQAVHNTWAAEGEPGNPPAPRTIWGQVKALEPGTEFRMSHGTRYVWFPRIHVT